MKNYTDMHRRALLEEPLGLFEPLLSPCVVNVRDPQLWEDAHVTVPLLLRAGALLTSHRSYIRLPWCGRVARVELYVSKIHVSVVGGAVVGQASPDRPLQLQLALRSTRDEVFALSGRIYEYKRLDARVNKVLELADRSAFLEAAGLTDVFVNGDFLSST